MQARVLTALVLVAALASPRAAVAGPSFEKEYKAAVKMENAGQVADALAAFEAIPVAQRDWNVRLHIASCKKKLGRLLDAEKDYDAIRTDPAADEATRDTAASDLDDVRARIPKLSIAVATGSSGASVAVDGKPVTVPTIHSVDPGPHVVVATRGGEVVFERKLEVSEGTTIHVLVDAPAAVAVKPAETPRPEGVPLRVESAPGSSYRTGAFVLAGVGVVSAAVGGYYALRTESLKSERDELATRGDPAAFDAAADARGAQTLARVGVGVAVAAGVSAAVLFVLSAGRSEPRSSTSMGLGVAPMAAGSWGLALRGGW